MSNKKSLQITESNVIDANTGEILSSTLQTNRTQYEQEPNYVKFYLQDVIRLKDLSASSNKVLHYIVSNMGYDNCFVAQKAIKMKMCKELDITLNTLNMQISNLKKAGILIPESQYGRGLYIVDPNLFARGNWKDIKQLRMTIHYNEDGTRTLTSNAPEKLKEQRIE